MRSRRSVAVGAIALFTACAQPAPPPGPDLAAEEKAVRDISMRWLAAAKAHDVEGEASAIGEDAIIFRSHEPPVVGTAAFKAMAVKDNAENPKGVIDWNTTSVMVASSGDLAVETGDYHFTGGGPKGDIADSGSFVTVYKKTGGQWKVVRDIGSSRMPEKKP